MKKNRGKMLTGLGGENIWGANKSSQLKDLQLQ